MNPLIGSASLMFFARLAGVISAMGGCLAILDAWLGRHFLGKGTVSSPGTLAPTGILFIFAGLGLAFFASGPEKRSARMGCRAAGVLTVLLAALALALHAASIRAGTKPNGDISDFPSLLGAASFLSAGLGLVFLPHRNKHSGWLCEALFAVPLTIALLALVGYLCSFPVFYRLASLEPRTAMSLYSTLAFLVLGAGALAARPDRGLMSVIAGSTLGGTVARFLILTPVGVPLASALLHALFRKSGFYNSDVAGWSFSYVNVLLWTAMVWWVALLLHRADSQLRELNEELESRVAARTMDLSQTNQRLEEQVQIRRQAEQALRESEASFRLMFFGNPLPLWVHSPETHRLLEANDAALAQYGWNREEFLALALEDIEMGDPHSSPASRAPSGSATRGTGQHRTKGGRIIQVETVSQAIEFARAPAVLFMANNITERLALEEQLRQSQKMESIGQLAGGIAHDFNNLLAVVQTHASFLALSPQPSGRQSEAVNQIIASVDRAAHLTKQLLAFSRKHDMQPELLDLNNVVSSFLQLLGRLLGSSIRVKTVLADGLPYIEADQGMLEQILLNLAVNARDAMPQGGDLTVTTRLAALDPAEAARIPGASGGTFACLSVKDSGTGIAPETMPRIFEPFFTTKESGKGTGLGLATVYGIVKQHRGWITVKSEPGQGAEFLIYLPAPARAAARRPAILPAAEIEPAGGSETILVVEDESTLRLLVHATLEQGGYRVLIADSGLAAQQIWTDRRNDIHAVLADVAVPGSVTGFDLARQFQTERPGLRIVLLCGQELDASVPNADGSSPPHTGVRYLQKPFNPPKLLHTVRTCLDARG